MSYRVIAIDPGESTGWATGVLDKNDKTLTQIEHGWDTWKDFGHKLYQVQFSFLAYDIIIYEAWRLRAANARQLTGSDLQPVQCVGQIKAAAWWGPTDPVLVSQEPAIKPVIDRQMAALGYEHYLPQSEVEHNRDAVRHLWYYAINKYGVKP